MHLSGLGSSSWPTAVTGPASCGPNPCGYLDDAGSVVGEASQACIDFMVCAAPNDPTTIALTKSLVAGVTTAAGQDVSNTVSDATTGLFSGLASNTTGMFLIGGAALIAFLLLSKR